MGSRSRTKNFQEKKWLQTIRGRPENVSGPTTGRVVGRSRSRGNSEFQIPEHVRGVALARGDPPSLLPVGRSAAGSPLIRRPARHPRGHVIFGGADARSSRALPSPFGGFTMSLRPFSIQHVPPRAPGLLLTTPTYATFFFLTLGNCTPLICLMSTVAI